MLTMTSPLTGYFRLKGNITYSVTTFSERNVSVPPNHAVVFSFREKAWQSQSVRLFRRVINYDQSVGRFRESTFLVWNRFRDIESDFAHVFMATKITVWLKELANTVPDHFELFFSFFHGKQIPEKLPSGFWNCSEDWNVKFHDHLACNHKIECEDGSDETEHCPFSSPECQGLVAFCNSCYKFGIRSEQFNDDARDFIQISNEYCVKLGGRFKSPWCECDWYTSLKSITNMHWKRLTYNFFNLYSNDMTLPAIYRHAILHGHSILYHHIISEMNYCYFGQKICFRSGYRSKVLTHHPCKFDIPGNIVCEFRPNETYAISSVSLTSSRQFWSTGPNSVTQCFGGHVMHTFLLCGSDRHSACRQGLRPCDASRPLPHGNRNYPVMQRTTTFPTFICNDELFSISYTLLCDFITDCYDGSDESMCMHPVCVNVFTCTNGQCLPYSNICDQVPQCRDESDEKNCRQFREVKVKYACTPSPVLISFNGVNKFLSLPMTSNQTCPESHYRCPGEFNNCLPVYTRCNGFYDCIDHQDEEGCKDMTCPGFFRCRASTICIHSDHLCDNWPHCPEHDDELLCDVTCPVDCLCQGHTFLCFQPFSAMFSPYIQYLDATSSGMTLSDVNNHVSLFHLILAKCSITLLPELHLWNLRILDLSGNDFQQINVTCFLGLKNLQTLSLSDNPLMSLFSGRSSEADQHTLMMVDLSYTTLNMLEPELFSSFSRLQKLNLTSTTIHTIGSSGFQFTNKVTELYMGGTPLKTFPLDIFTDLSNLHTIVTDNYKLCCSKILPRKFNTSSCYAPKDEISSCEDLLQSWAYRGFLWPITCLSVTGNIFCFCARLFTSSATSSSGFGVFVINLSMADFLMGMYIAIIGTADEQFRGRYLHYDDTWKSSVTCKLAGFLSLLSSEVSALMIWLITLDRFIVLHFPFSTLRFERMSAAVACLLTWFVGLCLALLPLLPFTSHWEFYSQTGICIPLPVTRKDFKGKVYSVGVLIIFNFVLFLFISAGQALIYWSVKRNTLKTNTTKMSRDMTIARRLMSVAVTDFLCWFPIGMCGILALAGIPISGEMNVALAIFVLPLNSAVNPFMYTFNTLAENRKKSNEMKFLQWLESHDDIIATEFAVSTFLV